MPIRRGARKPRDLEREHDADMAEADLGDELLESQPPVRAAARTAGVLVDNRDRVNRPAQLDRAFSQRILTRSRLGAALDLMQRRLTHIHDRAPTPMGLGDLRQVTHRARPRPAAPAAAPAPASPAAALSAAAPPPPPPRRSCSRRSTTPAARPSAPPFSTQAAPATGRPTTPAA